MPPYHDSSIEITDPRRGWKLGSRVLPSGFTIRLIKFTKPGDPPPDGPLEQLEQIDLTDAEVAAIWSKRIREKAGYEAVDRLAGKRVWLELDIETSATTPPRCVAMRAPQGISTPEQRFPLAGIIAESCATIASKNGSFELGSLDFPATRDEYEDALFEANRARRRRRTREAVTDERLAEVARIALEHPRTPTNAVWNRLHVSRGYARRLIKQAEVKGLL